MMLLVRGRSFSSVPAVRDCTVVRSHRTRRNDDPCRKNLVSPNMSAKTSGISRISEPAEDSRARPLVGWCLIGIGILHSIIGLVTGAIPDQGGHCRRNDRRMGHRSGPAGDLLVPRHRFRPDTSRRSDRDPRAPRNRPAVGVGGRPGGAHSRWHRHHAVIRILAAARPVDPRGGPASSSAHGSVRTPRPRSPRRSRPSRAHEPER